MTLVLPFGYGKVVSSFVWLTKVIEDSLKVQELNTINSLYRRHVADFKAGPF